MKHWRKVPLVDEIVGLLALGKRKEAEALMRGATDE